MSFIFKYEHSIRITFINFAYYLKCNRIIDKVKLSTSNFQYSKRIITYVVLPILTHND